MVSSAPPAAGPGLAPERRRPSAAHGRVAAALASLVVVGGFVWAAAGLGGTSRGPLSAPENVTLSGMKLPTGGSATWGSILVDNTSPSPVTLRSVKLEGGIDGSASAIRIDAVEAVDQDSLHGTGIGMADDAGYDVVPANLRAPVAGYVLAPGHRVSVLVRYTGLRHGAWRFDYADVRYDAAGRDYTVRMSQALGVCVDLGDTCDVGSPPGL